MHFHVSLLSLATSELFAPVLKRRLTSWVVYRWRNDQRDEQNYSTNVVSKRKTGQPNYINDQPFKSSNDRKEGIRNV